MRTIERTKAFHRDWKKVGSGVHGKRASGLLQAVVALLVEDRPLPPSKHDHQLTGEWDWYTSGDANYQSGIYVGNDNQSWIPSHTYVNTRLGVQTSVYTIQAWARNLFDDNKAVAAFRDIYFANTDSQYPPLVPQGPRPNFDDFVPWRQTVSYPSERTYGLTFLMRFGAAVQ